MPITKSVNKNFFKEWSPDMAYILGFFAADGYITVNRRGGQFWCVDIVDKQLIKEIKNVIKAEHKISSRIRKRNKSVYRSYRLQIGSIEMCEDLRRLGYSERKANNLSLPNIPSRYLKDFVRGYFDGDGNVWSGFVHKERKTKTYVMRTVFTSCSGVFLDDLKNNLEKAGVLQGRLRKEKDTYYRLVYSVRNSLKLYYFMYNGLNQSKLFLKRKKSRFERYIKTVDNAVVA